MTLRSESEDDEIFGEEGGDGEGDDEMQHMSNKCGRLDLYDLNAATQQPSLLSSFIPIVIKCPPSLTVFSPTYP